LNVRIPCTFTGTPDSSVGWKVHRLAACNAASRNNGWPFITAASMTLPSSEMVTCTCTAPAARAAGAVQVQVTISEDGRVIEAAVMNGHPLLRDAALQAARRWTFQPTELSGVPVKVQGILTFNFTLQ
jgi:TonB family protein